ncbi:MAG TPA: arylesterase [Burkholderiales bacterium]|nr:arylesterase [Burkholderiales bacterium]
MLRIILFTFAVCTAAAAGAAPVVMVFGDSLSAGYGLAQGAGWVDLLQRRLQQEKLDYKVVNASISGETTLGGRNRISSALDQHRPAIVIIELGANDGLRGDPIEAMRANLTAILAACRRHRAQALLVGMELPPNYGTDYVRKFRATFAAVAREQHAPLVPFLLAGFADDPAQFQADGLHPVAAAQPRMLENVWRALQPMLRRAVHG